jgi:hypothetical protein
MNAWEELLGAAREFHEQHPHGYECRLCVALAAFSETPTLFDAPLEEPPFDPLAVDRNDIGGFRATDPSTSRRSAIDIYPKTGSMRGRAFAVILAAGDRGATVSEVIASTGIPHQTISTRLSELKRGGWVVARGERRGDHGMAQDVLVATDKARAEAAARRGLAA